MIILSQMIKSIYFIGICGIGMSALAQFYKKKGYSIYGCDKNFNDSIAYLLRKDGIIVEDENNVSLYHISLSMYVVTIDTVGENHPAIILAKKYNIQIFKRSYLLATVFNPYKKSFGVTGSHGKTTTSGLLGFVLHCAKKSPTMFVGGIMSYFNNNFVLGDSDYIVVEADDAYKSFLSLSPSCSIITSISIEHLETYKNIDDIIDTYAQYCLNHVGVDTVIINYDDPYIRILKYSLRNKKIITYGIENDADVKAVNIILQEDGSWFDIVYFGEKLGTFFITLLGMHNVKNALGVFIAAYQEGIAIEVIKEAFLRHKGVERRFEYLGVAKNGALLYDDYGHHPREISALLDVIRIKKKNKKVCILFQFHKFSRTKYLWNDFMSVFKSNSDIIDHLYIAEVYHGGEVSTIEDEQYSAAHFVNILSLHMNVFYFKTDTFKDLKDVIINNLKKDDLILSLGAGMMNHCIKMLS